MQSKKIKTADRGFTKVGELLSEIRDVYEIPIVQLGEIAGYSRSQMYNFIEGQTSHMSEAAIVALAKEFRLPVRKLMYYNARARLSETDKAWLARARRDEDAGEEGEVDAEYVPHYFARVQVPILEFNQAEPRQRLNLLLGHSHRRSFREGLLLPRPGMVYFEQHTDWMVTREVGETGRSIAPGAVVEVEPRPLANIDPGQIVFAQVGPDEKAGAWVWHRVAQDFGIFERFSVFNPDNASLGGHRVHEAADGSDPPLDEQRVIFGVVIRVVHQPIDN